MPSRRLFHRHDPDPAAGGGAQADATFALLEVDELARVFAVPSWLRDLGLMSWLLVGAFLLLAGIVWLLSLTATIVIPVLTASIVAAVLSPIVRWLAPHRLGRGGAAAVVLLAAIAVGIGVFVLLLAGVTSQSADVQQALQGAVAKLQSWLQDAGVSAGKAKAAGSGASASVSDAFHALLDGVASGITALASAAAFVSFAALSLFFLLKDGPLIRRWTERHMGVPDDLARIITTRTLQSLRGYFVGVTVVALFNAVVIGLGAVIFDVPEVGAIMVVNFVAAYIPYLGAWSAGAFTVLIALGAQGSATALAMVVVVLLANGILQQLIQPIAYGAALGIHPLAVLIVTIAGGCLFGGIGLILAAPVTSAITRISTDVARARVAATATATATVSVP